MIKNRKHMLNKRALNEGALSNGQIAIQGLGDCRYDIALYEDSMTWDIADIDKPYIDLSISVKGSIVIVRKGKKLDLQSLKDKAMITPYMGQNHAEGIDDFLEYYFRDYPCDIELDYKSGEITYSCTISINLDEWLENNHGLNAYL